MAQMNQEKQTQNEAMAPTGLLDNRCRQLGHLLLADYHVLFRQLLQEPDRLVREDEKNTVRLSRERARLGKEISDRAARGETVPEAPADFVAAQQAVRGHVFRARPLYLGLEPASGATPRELAALAVLELLETKGDLPIVRQVLASFSAAWKKTILRVLQDSGADHWVKALA